MLLRKVLIFFFLLCLTAIGVFTRTWWILAAYQDSFLHRNSSICACDKCLMEYDPWLTELMRESPEPFLSTTNNVSEETFNWWKGIQTDRRNYAVYNKTVDKVFQMFPHHVDFTRASPDLCRTCAVVGNSGNLNGSHYGPLIDFHDIVIRMNRGPTKGFERDVGNKTTHRVMYPHSSMDLDNTTHLVLFPYKIYDFEWLIRAFTPRKKENAKPGLAANKDLVSVFGFGADRKGNWYHYYEKIKNKRLRTGNHPGSYEYKYIAHLHEQEKIHFFRGW